MFKKVGVFVNRFDGPFQQRVTQGLSQRLCAAGADVLYFNSFSNTNSDNTYEKLELLMTDLVPIESLDAVVVLTDTYRIPEHLRQVEERIRLCARADAPLVSIGAQIEGMISVMADEDISVEPMIRHLAEKHNAKRICYMSGILGHPDAVKRLACFERVMRAMGRPIGKHDVFHGDFWKGCGKQAADWFYADSTPPDAIVCANDYMAIALCSELAARNIRVPEDVLVTGYDDVWDASSYSPSLTTMCVDYMQLAVTAADAILKAWNGKQQPQVYTIPPEPQFRESCGCMLAASTEVRALKRRIFERADLLAYTSIWQTYFSINISGCDPNEGLKKAILTALSDYGVCSDMTICLCAKGTEPMEEMEYGQFLTERMRVWLSVKEGHLVDLSLTAEDERFFSRRQLLPRAGWAYQPGAYFFALLHTQAECLGYAAVRLAEGKSYDFTYQTFMVTIANALHDQIDRLRLQNALKRNERMSITDPLTGLLNRRGFEQVSSGRCKAAMEMYDRVALLSLDLDGLKRINDRYGHAEGDFAIRTVADAMRDVFGERGVLSRTGGDEFVAMLTISSQEDMERMVEQLHETIRQKSETSRRPYGISASIGVAVEPLRYTLSMEKLMKESDEALYRVKKSRVPIRD